MFGRLFGGWQSYFFYLRQLWQRYLDGFNNAQEEEPQDEAVQYTSFQDGDRITGGDNDDTFTIKDMVGNARIDGGDGNDTLDLGRLNPALYDLVSYQNIFTGTYSGRVIVYDEDGNRAGVVRFRNIETIDTTIRPDGIVNGTAGDDLIDASYVDWDNDRVDALDARNQPNVGTDLDVIRAGDGDDTVYGLNDRDNIRGGTGSDEIYGGDNNDTLFGDEGNDRIEGGDGNDVAYGNDDQDDIYGQAGNDRLFGGAGDDTITGGEGNDVMYGDANNRFEGATGRDTFVFGADDGNDKIWDFVQGVDTILLEGYEVGVNDPNFEYRNGNTILTYGDTQITVYVNELTMDDISF